MNIDPQFADAENGDFTLPVGSPLLTFASDGGAIGDPRWAGNATSISDNAAAQPKTFNLGQNYPNPFNPQTTIRFNLDKTGYASLSVFNLLGHKVAQLINGNMSAGEHKVTFDAENLPSGIYFYRLEAQGNNMTKKMIILE